MLSDLLGTLGLLFLLGTFFATLTGRLQATDCLYQLLNGVGAAILAWYSIRLGIWIFSVLEATWSLVAWWGLARNLKVRYWGKGPEASKQVA